MSNIRNMKKIVLCILDGWGHTENRDSNAIASASIPFYRSLLKQHPNSLLQASGEFVGLPNGQIGNSEVGHLTIGAGRRVFQDLPKINHALQNGDIFKSPGINKLIKAHSRCHLIGIVSDGAVHGHVEHLIRIAKFLRQEGVDVVIHAIADGRDVAPKSVLQFLNQIESAGFEITSISGRFYAMDRDNRTERTQAAFATIVGGMGAKYTAVQDYVNENYKDGITDEFLVPASAENYSGFASGDAVFFTNYRADRMRQIASAICQQEFTMFKRNMPKLSAKVIMRPYSTKLASCCDVLFPHEEIKNTLGEVISDAGLSQLRLAETEKYAHVTYFFNGGNETPYIGEDRILVPSPRVETYDKRPQMSAYEITHYLADAIESGNYDMITVNYANADMVGHTGDLSATIKSIEAIDVCLQGMVDICKRNRYELLITSDHGNAECMYDEIAKQPLTAHTLNPVPFIYVGPRKIGLQDGELADVAPTILELMGIAKPKDMSGESRII
ncbi:MAG: phosphoglyceromutase [Candidatus Midichloriaceae bacterium]|jgi:2,3-bisphosphoglycerate-independent phosphoglycerate mutase|nr:phosphoglyceromutase [Candidatus Midichloriaceae bacterium]